MKPLSKKLVNVLNDAQLTRTILHNEFDGIEDKLRFSRDENNALVTAYNSMFGQFRECLKACDFVDDTVMNADEEEREILFAEYKNAPKGSAYKEQLRVLLKDAGLFE